MKLKGKVALVTGASRGIGRGIAEIFAEEGADVAVNYIDAAQKPEAVAEWVRSKGRRSMITKADVANRAQVEAMFEEVWTQLGPVDILVNNAGIAKRQGSIVNIGSIQAGKVLPGRTHYAPAKLALEALTRNVSAEVTPLGIRVNCIHPGLIDTDMTAWVMKDKELLPGILAQISLGRVGDPREIGTVAAFLASDEASYLTGQSIFVDGGWVGK